MEKKYDKTYPLSVVQNLIDEMQEAEHTDAIKKAAKVLVDHVEKYVRQECLRSELLARKDNLKKTVGEMNAILIHPDYWRNSQLSIARFYGMIRINGTAYFHDKRSDYLVRDDFTKFISGLGMPTVEKSVKRYADQAKAKKILNRLTRIVKARRKAEKRQRKEDKQSTLFER